MYWCIIGVVVYIMRPCYYGGGAISFLIKYLMGFEQDLNTSHGTHVTARALSKLLGAYTDYIRAKADVMEKS